MRILQVAPPWFAVPPPRYGGIELVVSGLADGLVDAGHDTTLLASGGSVTRARLLTVYDEAPSVMLGDTMTELAHALRAYGDPSGYDLVHDHTALGAALGAVAQGPPVVHTLHGPWTDAAVRLYRLISDRVHLVAISHDQASRVPSDVTLAGVVHNGVPVERYPFGAGGGGYLAFLGRASEEKGPATAIEVARRLGRPLRMAIKVNEAAERRYFDEVLTPLFGPDVEVVVDATHAEKVDILSGAPVLLMPITWPEPFGLVLTEAGACGTPVVAFALGAAPEIVDDGRSGVLVPPGDVDAFCDAVERAERLDRRACRDHVVHNFSTAPMVAGYTAIYERVTASPRTVTLDDCRSLVPNGRDQTAGTSVTGLP